MPKEPEHQRDAASRRRCGHASRGGGQGCEGVAERKVEQCNGALLALLDCLPHDWGTLMNWGRELRVKLFHGNSSEEGQVLVYHSKRDSNIRESVLRRWDAGLEARCDGDGCHGRVLHWNRCA